MGGEETTNMRGNTSDNMERGAGTGMSGNQGNGSMFYTPPDPVVSSPFAAVSTTNNGNHKHKTKRLPRLPLFPL